MKIFGEKDVLLMTELKIDTMSQNETTKLDIIVESNDENGPGIPIELVAEWAMLLNKYYPLALEKRNMMN